MQVLEIRTWRRIGRVAAIDRAASKPSLLHFAPVAAARTLTATRLSRVLRGFLVVKIKTRVQPAEESQHKIKRSPAISAANTRHPVHAAPVAAALSLTGSSLFTKWRFKVMRQVVRREQQPAAAARRSFRLSFNLQLNLREKSLRYLNIS